MCSLIDSLSHSLSECYRDTSSRLRLWRRVCKHAFLVGTQSLKNENQIHLLEYLEDSNSLSKAVFRHSCGEVWDVSTHPKHSQLMTTCYSSQSQTFAGKVENHCSLWTLPIDMSKPLTDEDSTTSSVNSVLATDRSHKNVSTINADFNVTTKSSNRFNKITTFRWSPHSNCGLIGIANSNCIYAKDLRVKSTSNTNAWSIPNSHSQLVRDLDFNPNAQYYLSSCGDDCETRFWDVRNTTRPVLSLTNHSHWVWSVRYNLFHDQLVLTSSSDSRVVLIRAVSVASQPFGHLLEDEMADEDNGVTHNKSSSAIDGVIATYEEHEDSVYAVEWSVSDPWIFASLSYDGRLVINKVPKSEKFNILF
ncbi:unnamed protein product [Oppiella nova]|uniref:EIPR1-like beta-propeller domain-containing protein n=1 Tax=Oppiella nova TaxID=334625 RepID=A0A7R9QAE2_9ACAR|nr:unnamed protein product [Oppiella nova]CAG2158895.1 unnamed protein product [Oppiella nova]